MSHPQRVSSIAPARTPSRKRSRPSEELTDTTPSESKIIWKDSPAEKQIKASGTGRVQVEKEMHGFVDRLERASARSPSLPEQKSKSTKASHLRASSRSTALTKSNSDPCADRLSKKQSFAKHHETSRRRVLERSSSSPCDSTASDTGPPIVRHLLFSPDTSAKKKARPGIANRAIGHSSPKRIAKIPSESQDEILVALDKIDEKYSSVVLAPNTDFGTARTPPETPDPLGSGTNPTVESSSSYSCVTPNKSTNSKQQFSTNSATHATDDEFGSPFTEESWQIIDQLEFEASQKIVQAKQPLVSQRNVSSQRSPHRARPTTTPATPPLIPSSKRKLQQNDLPPNAHGPTSQVPKSGGKQQVQAEVVHDEAEDFKQLLVLDVVRDGMQRQLVLHTVDELDQQIQVTLLDDWFELEIDVGASINVIASGGDAERRRLLEMVASRQVVVDNEQLVVIVHPSTLISPTTVTASIECLRRGVLKDVVPVTSPTNPKALVGTLKHKLFEKALFCGMFSMDFLLQHAQEIIKSSIVQLCECGLGEEQVMDELQKAAKEYQEWMGRVFSAQGVALERPNGTAATSQRVRVHRVVAIEEMIWSGKWGLKGAMDATIEVSFEDNLRRIVALELKTGDKVYTRIQHEGQVILYTLLLNERYPPIEPGITAPPQGFLLYVPGTETHLVQAFRSHLRGLLIARNQVASFLFKYKSSVENGSTSDSCGDKNWISAQLPPMLSSRRDCEKCFQRAECFLVQASPQDSNQSMIMTEGQGSFGSFLSGGSSAMDDLISNQTGHLSGSHLRFFQRWCRLIDLEQVYAEQNATTLRQAMQSGNSGPDSNRTRTRNKAATGGDGFSGSISDLQLVSSHTSLNVDSGNIKWHYLTLAQRQPVQQSQSTNSRAALHLRFRIDDQVILSAQSLVGKRRRKLAVLRAQIASIGDTQLVLRVGESIPELILQGRSSVGSDFCWRVDKDVMMNGFNRSKENLVRLFTGKRPETNLNGVSVGRSNLVAELGQQHVESLDPEVCGDIRRRRLIVDLMKPRFNSLKVVDFMLENIKEQAQVASSMQEFRLLNLDQQEAVERIVNAVDYTLVLGMPGTGKTSTMAFVVRLLLVSGFSVLITSYTHSAVDNLVLKVLEKMPQGKELLRVGNVSQVDPRLRSYTLEEQASKLGSVAQVDAFLARVQLVASTCLSVNSNVVFQKRRFDFCVVDEASQLTLPVILGPLRCADTFTLVGDQYQLPPLVASRHARSAGLDHSLFALLAEAFPEAMKRLTVQYRMNQEIVLVANRLIYGYQLKCGSELVASNRLVLSHWDGLLEQFDGRASFQWILQALSSHKGVAFVDTDTLRIPDSVGGGAGLEQKTGAGSRTVGGGGMTNTAFGKLVNFVEAELMVGLVAALVFGGLDPREIGLLSPFRSQVNLIWVSCRSPAISKYRRLISTRAKTARWC